jgi:solute carrier family 44 (choline transporter-like protein), member 2/4/5
MKFGFVQGFGDFYELIGEFFITLLTGYIGYVILSKAEPYKSELFSPLLPTVFIVIIAFFVGNMFMSLYSIATDSILVCSILDEEIM